MIQTLADHRQCFIQGETYDIEDARARKFLAQKVAKPAPTSGEKPAAHPLPSLATGN
jgi:hypothetical protein